MVADLPAVVSDLEAAFVAALQRDEELAADDLASSLLHDLDIPRAVARMSRPELLLADGRAFPVVEVGLDHLVAGERNPVCVPTAFAVVRGDSQRVTVPSQTGGNRERTPFSSVTLLERMRRWASEELPVRVATASDSYEGVLTRATPDHVAIQRASREIFVSWGSVREVRRLRDDQPLSLEDRG